MNQDVHTRLDFTTSNPQEAERWLRDAHPYYQDDFVDYVVQGVKDGIVRVRNPYFHKDGAGVVLDTPDGARITAEPGDYIIRTANGTFHKFTADEFAAAEKEQQ